MQKMQFSEFVRVCLHMALMIQSVKPFQIAPGNSVFDMQAMSGGLRPGSRGPRPLRTSAHNLAKKRETAHVMVGGFVYVYVYIYVYICVYVYISICIYI